MKSKYKPRFAKQLLEGLRKDGKSIAECCRLWGVSKDAYYDWLKVHPKFAYAASMAEMDSAAWWHQLNRDVADGSKRGNAGLIQFALKNIEGINWSDKVEVNNTHEEQIHTIQIEVLPSKQQQLEGRIIDVDQESSVNS